MVVSYGFVFLMKLLLSISFKNFLVFHLHHSSLEVSRAVYYIFIFNIGCLDHYAELLIYTILFFFMNPHDLMLLAYCIDWIVYENVICSLSSFEIRVYLVSKPHKVI